MRRHHEATLFEVPGYGPAVLISGGESATGPLDSILVYDVQKNNMIVPRKMATTNPAYGCVGRGSQLRLLGGGYTSLDRQQASDAIDVYNIVENTVGAQPGFNLNVARGGHSAVKAFGNSVVFMGGTGQGGSVLNSLEIVYEYMDPNQGAYVIKVGQSSNQGPVIVPFLPGRVQARNPCLRMPVWC